MTDMIAALLLYFACATFAAIFTGAALEKAEAGFAIFFGFIAVAALAMFIIERANQ